jgi:hypothetical protein
LMVLEATDSVLVEASMRSATLRLVCVSESGEVSYVYAQDLQKIKTVLTDVIDINSRRFSKDGGVTWAPFVPVEGATLVARISQKNRRVAKEKIAK